MATRNKGRYDEARMAETMYAERVIRDAQRNGTQYDSAEAQAMYYRGVHDTIEFMNGMASAGVSATTISSLLAQMSAQTADEVLPTTTTH